MAPPFTAFAQSFAGSAVSRLWLLGLGMSSMWSIQCESVIWKASFSGCAATACTTPW